jgi:hypothetical protein
MLRRLFTALSTLSLLLCVAVVVLWVRSQSAVHMLALTRGRLDVVVASGPHSLLVSWRVTDPPLVEPGPPLQYVTHPAYVMEEAPGFRNLGGFSYRGRRPQLSKSWVHEWWFPHWAAAVPCAVLPLAWLVRRHRRRVGQRRLNSGATSRCWRGTSASRRREPLAPG